MFKLNESQHNANVPGPALRDATPKQLAGGRKVGAGGTATGGSAGLRPQASPGAPKTQGKLAPPHLDDDDEEWAEF
jgi:hypothetical protein